MPRVCPPSPAAPSEREEVGPPPRRTGRRERPRIDEEIRLLELLGTPGCPICAQTTGVDRQYFFWFFNENYAWPTTTTALAHSLGFCLAHGDQLARLPSGSSQLRYVHEILVREVRAQLALLRGPRRDRRGLPGTLAAPALCPACRHREASATRSAFWLGRILEDPSQNASYGHPGILCFPHLQVAAPALTDRTLIRVLHVHRSLVEEALDLLARVRPEGDLASALRQPLSLCVGHEATAGAEPYPSPHEDTAAARLDDPVRRMRAWAGTGACPLCLAVRHAWLEWTAWLHRALRQGDHVDDLLPTCPCHVWALVRTGDPALALAATRAAVTSVAAEVSTALPRSAPAPSRFRARLAAALAAARRPARTTREILARGIRCPVCHRLSVAAQRATELLVALLEDPGDRTALQRGYGLCLKHFVHALPKAPSLEVRDALVRMQDARLAVLHWELEESGRKAAWQYRPEAKGREDTAWQRALFRFSGSLRAPEAWET